MSHDPFTQVYNGLWKCVERNQEIQNIVRQGNRIKFKTEFDQKQQISDGDVPELILFSTGGPFNEGGTSTTRRITKNYTWGLVTGSMMNTLFNQLSFELYRSLVDYECILCALTWCDCNFVTNCRLVNVEEGTRMTDLDRDVPGWASLWSCEVDMEFQTQNLRLR